MSTIVVEEETLIGIISDAVKRTVTNQVPRIVHEATKKKWLTKEELKILTGWSDKTIYNLRKERKIPFSQHDRKILYPRDGIEEFLQEGYVPSN